MCEPWGADHLYATDFKWWKHWIETVTQDFEGRCWTQERDWPQDQRPEAWGVTCLKSDLYASGLSRDPETVHCGRNSGYAAIGLAYGQLKAERVILLGYDMKTDGVKRHWFGAHPDGLEANSPYPDFIGRFKTINPAEYGIEILNATRSTALDCFPCYDLDELCAALS